MTIFEKTSQLSFGENVRRKNTLNKKVPKGEPGQEERCESRTVTEYQNFWQKNEKLKRDRKIWVSLIVIP